MPWRHYTLQWRHNQRDCVLNHQPQHCLLNRLFKAQIKETSKLRTTGLCEGNSPVTGEFPAQRASNAENVSIWWRHHYTPDSCASLSGRTSYRKSSWSFETGRLIFTMTITPWNLTGISTAMLPMYLSNFRAIGKVWTRDFTRTYGKTSVHLPNRGSGFRTNKKLPGSFPFNINRP